MLSFVVTVGIALFIIGFVMTVMSLSEDSTASAGTADRLGAADGYAPSGSAATLVLGLVLSMTGVVVATTVPAAFFIRASKQRL